MTTVVIANFSGMQPIVDASLLPDANAQYSENTWLYRGLIRGFRRGVLAHTNKYKDTLQIYRIPKNNANPPDFSDTGSVWEEFPDPFMMTIRNPTVNDQYHRYFFFPSDQYNSNGSNPKWPAGHAGTVPPKYSSLDVGTNTFGPLYTLGIPIPTSVPVVTPAPDFISTVATADTTPGNTTLTVVSTANVLAGMTITDTTITTTSATASAPSSSTSGTNIIHLTSATGIIVGMEVQDLTNTSAIIAGTKVSGISGTDIILSGIVISPGVSTGDHFHFINHNQITLNTDVSTVNSPTQVTMNVAADFGGVLTGDTITFSTTSPESRAYVYTYVSAYSEEGPPSPADVKTGDPTGTWSVEVFNPTPTMSENRNLKYIRIYRTVTDTAGNASYYQVKQIDITATDGSSITYSDSAKDDEITANVQLTSVDFTAPPADLQGVVLMANGVAAGFSNSREIWFSSPYQLWAWPAAYALSVDYPIVGLTASGSSLNVLTEGTPFIVTGVTPGTMTVVKISANEPCIGRGSIAMSQDGAYYASPNGIMILSSSGVNMLTKDIYEKEYNFLLQPWNWAAGRYGTSYVAFFKGNGVSGIDPDGDLLHGLVVDSEVTNVPLSFINFTGNVVNLYQDETSGQLFGVSATGTVMQWNPPIGQRGTTSLWSWEWRSKKFRFTMPQQFKAFVVYFDVPSEVMITPSKRDITNAPYNATKQYMIVQIYADGQFLTQREIQKSGEVLLINKGSKWTYWEVRMQGQVSVRMFKMASSVKELKAA